MSSIIIVISAIKFLCNIMNISDVSRSIVQQLRNGEDFVPEFFQSVTVLFSDIPSFNDMVAKCPPFSIVTLLHQLYSKMDKVINMHDVYKVETIRDSYMVWKSFPIL